MSLVKKLVIGWLCLSAVSGIWILVTGNTSEEAMVANLCKDAFKDNEGHLGVKFLNLTVEAGLANLMLKVEYDDDIEPILEATRGLDKGYITCNQKLVSNVDGLEPWAKIVITGDKGLESLDNLTYEVTDIDIYDAKDDVWWSEL